MLTNKIKETIALILNKTNIVNIEPSDITIEHFAKVAEKYREEKNYMPSDWQPVYETYINNN